jgi:phage tail-like protein
MATVNNPRSTLLTDPIRNFRFLVDFIPHDSKALPGLDKATFGFTSVSGLSVTTDSIPYREGGYNTTVHQIPGQTTFAPISLQRGVLINTDANWEWMRRLFATVQGSAKNVQGGSFRCDLDISVLSHPIPGSASDLAGSGAGRATSADDHVAMRFRVYNAWITSLAYSDLNAGDNAILVEQATLVHEGFDVKWAPSVTSSAARF